jgi:hypothetical protein
METHQLQYLVGHHAEEPFFLDGLDAELPVIRAQMVLGTDIHVRKNAGNSVDLLFRSSGGVSTNSRGNDPASV